MIAHIIRIFSSDVEVEVNNDYFSFRRKGQEINFRTVIYISNDGGKPRVLGVGDSPVITESNIRIDLFKPEAQGVEFVAKAECLDAFFRYCIRKTLGHRTVIRPRILFSNSESLRTILCGYQRIILSRAAMNAGARECLFTIK